MCQKDTGTGLKGFPWANLCQSEHLKNLIVMDYNPLNKIGSHKKKLNHYLKKMSENVLFLSEVHT